MQYFARKILRKAHINAEIILVQETHGKTGIYMKCPQETSKE